MPCIIVRTIPALLLTPCSVNSTAFGYSLLYQTAASMSNQVPRQKHAPLEVLQSMVNAILIETGKALRSSSRDGSRTFTHNTARLRQTIPSAVEKFQEALDDLECDILRAKSALNRDLENLRAKRLALENPTPVVDEVPFSAEKSKEINNTNGDSVASESIEPPAEPISKQEEIAADSPQNKSSTVPDPPEPSVSQSSDTAKLKQGLTPPNSIKDLPANPKSVGLGIRTDGGTTTGTTSNPGTADIQNSAIDSLFDVPDHDNNTAESELNFDNMDFSLSDSITTNTQTQTQDQSQTQTNDFDLSTFGTTSQDFSMPGPNTSTDTTTANNINDSNSHKPVDDMLGDLGTNAAGGNSMDLDLDLGMAGAEDSVFDDMFFDGGDDTGRGGGGEMEHGEFDNAFFGLD